MNQKLEYLNKYIIEEDGYVRLVSDNEIETIDSLPRNWYKIFKEKDFTKRKNLILKIWKKYAGVELRNTISYLNDFLEDIELIEINKRYSILYTIKNRLGQVVYYEGRSPHLNFNNDELEKEWSKIPSSIQSFYENIHNGFYYYASGSMGLVALEDVVFLGDEEFDWSIIADLDDPLQIDLETSFGFFSNGMGTYVAIDYKNCTDDRATLWSAKEQPEYNINFWDYVDEWYVIGFEV